MSTFKLWINASEIAALTGYNKYQDRFESIAKYIYKGDDLLQEQDQSEKYDPDFIVDQILNSIDTDQKIENLANSNPETGQDLAFLSEEINQAIIQKSFEISKPQEREIISELISNPETDTSLLSEETRVKVKENKDSLQELLESKLIQDNQVQQIQTVISGRINKSFGTRREKSVIDLYEEETGNKIYGNNDKLYKMNMDSYIVCGKIDGWIIKDEEKILIEVKNRKNRIFTQIPIYDQIQVNIYMKMLSLTRCIFIQAHNGKMDVREIEYNSDLIQNVLQELEKTVEFIYSLKEDEELRLEYMNSDTSEREEIFSEKQVCF